MIPVSMTLSDPGPGFQGRSILESNMSKTVQDSAIVTIELKREVMYDVFGLIYSDVE